MAIMATPKKFAMQQVFEVLLRSPADKTIIGYLTDTKTSGLENTVTMVYPTGGRGNTYIGTGFAHSRKATLKVTLATWNTDVLAAQNGTTVYTGSSNITYYDTMLAGTAGALATKFTAVGTVGSEIGKIYKVNADGTYGKEFTQAATATVAGTFAYASATKAITFFATDPDTAKAGDYFACAYTYKTSASAQQIKIEADAVPPTVLVTAYGLARDTCTGLLFPAAVEGTAQIDGNWNFDLSASGEPVVQNLTMDFVRGCVNKDLYTFTIFEESDEAE